MNKSRYSWSCSLTACCFSPLPVCPCVFICMGVCGRSVFDFFFFFLSLASLVFAFDSLLVSRRCSLTSALFCISYDFGSNFWSFGKDVAGKKRKLIKKKKVCGLCTDVKVKLIKTRQRTVVDLFSSLWVKATRGPWGKTTNISQHACSVGGWRIKNTSQWNIWSKKIWLERLLSVMVFGWREDYSL